MAIVVRLGPLPLRRRLAARTAELERIFPTTVQVTEVGNIAELVTAITRRDPPGSPWTSWRPRSSQRPLPRRGRSRYYETATPSLRHSPTIRR